MPPKKSLPPQLYSYKGGGSKDYSSPVINSYLRGRTRGDAELEERAAALSGLLQPLKVQMLVYRGTGYAEFNGATVKQGSVYICRGFTSTTLSMVKAKTFALGGDKGFLLTITLQPGVKTFHFDGDKYIMKSAGEKEILVDKDTEFRIESVRADTKLRLTHVTVTAVRPVSGLAGVPPQEEE